MFESAILGIIQGVVEWLPVSSEAIVGLAKIHIFEGELSLTDLVSYALFLHLGTFLAALIYFRKKVFEIIRAIFAYKNSSIENRGILKFIVFSSLVSGVVGFSILWGLENIEEKFSLAGKGVTILIGILLIFTALVQFGKARSKSHRTPSVLNLKDGIVAGIAQGLSILPGISRSGFTISALLLRKVQEEHALMLSFLMSIPAVLGANIVLNAEKFAFSIENIIGLFTAFIFGLLTIHILLKIARRLNFAWFVFAFGCLTILAVFV